MSIKDASPCTACGGSGKVCNPGGPVDCRACDGSGRRTAEALPDLEERVRTWLRVARAGYLSVEDDGDVKALVEFIREAGCAP